MAKIFREIGIADELESGVRNITNYSKIYFGKEPVFEDGDVFNTNIQYLQKMKKILELIYIISYS